MCSIFGRVTLGADKPFFPMPLGLAALSQARGRDSWGMRGWRAEPFRVVGDLIDPDADDMPVAWRRWVIGNTRAEPTTEWVPDKTPDDVQPFVRGSLTVAHNGTIANDVALCERYGIDPDADGGSKIDTARWAAVAAEVVSRPEHVIDLLSETVGSYGIAVGHESGWLVLATNYKPIWTRRIYGGQALEWTSVAPRGHQTYLDALDEGWQMLPPYSALTITDDGIEWQSLRAPEHTKGRALVVCSGGLDSVVTAFWMQAQGYAVDLLHVLYGARAEERERIAVENVAERGGFGLRYLDLTSTFSAIGHSRLTGSWEGAAAGVEGAEYAIEWVPARNTILLSVAVGMAEAHGYRVLALGNNLEESGAYPDNEQEFIGRFNDMLPFSVADGVRLSIMEPVGHLMKHEIVRLGIEVGAPLHLTWSCYDGGEKHCGDCGPCFMRKRGFEMAGALDPMEYLTDAEAVR